MNTTKTFASRDSATAVLRKAGVAKADYSNFIELKDGRYVVTMPGSTTQVVDAAEQEIMAAGDAAANAAVVEETEAEVKAVKEPKAAKEPKAVKAVKAAKAAKEPKAVKAPKAAKEPKVAKVSISGTIATLVAKNKTNEEIWKVIQPQFNLSDDKRWYPGWYRSHELRKAKAVKAAKAGK